MTRAVRENRWRDSYEKVTAITEGRQTGSSGPRTGLLFWHASDSSGVVRGAWQAGITGAVERPLNLQISDLEKMPQVSVAVKDHDGNLTTYEGVELAELLKAAGAPIGEKLRGANMAGYVLAEAKDGYRVIFALPELDSAFTDSKVLVAYARRTESHCPMARGPFGSWPHRKSILPAGFVCFSE